MEISNEQIEKLIKEYQVYTKKIVNCFYSFASPAVKDELCHVGLIGLWKGILAYYKKEPEIFVHKEFVNTICTYIRREMSDLLHKSKVIRISYNQWRNFLKANKLVTANPNATEEQHKSIITNAGLRYDWYLKAKEMICPASLDITMSDDNDTDTYNFITYKDKEIKRYTEQSYINYIIGSAMYGVKNNRDKELIHTWLKSVNSGKEMGFTELGKLFGLSPCMVGVIINKFVNVCRFVRDCEYEFLKNPNGTIYFSEIAEKNKTHNGKKVPGVKWILRNRKWKVEITIGKNKSVYIGYFEKYEDAVRARRDAEIKYRGFSDINI